MSQVIRWYSASQLAELRGVNVCSVWRHAQIGLLPPPVKLSSRCTRWPGNEIEALETARLRGANDAAIRKLVMELVAARKQKVAA